MLEAEGYAFWLFPVVYANRTEATDAAIEGLAGQSPNVFATGNLAEAFVTEPVWRDVPKVFWNMEWEGQPIGDFSFGKRAQGWEGYALYSVTFLRDNRVIRVESSRLKGDYRNPEKSIDPDPRQIAAALDRYYSADPTEAASAAEKSERNTLRIEIQSPRPLVKGTAYAFACPLNQEGNDLTEVRFRVTQGEVLEVVNEVAERPGRGVVPMEDRRFSVRFTKGGRQTLSCYHINAAGECLAWGKLEVEVLEQ